jgi:mannose-6-phosphate isomerase-like protein (cupin superfamily)
MSKEKFSARRVVTRINEQGRSVIGIDGPPAETIEFALGGGLHEIWTDLAGPLDRKGSTDSGAGPIRLGPPSGGVKIRWFTVAPAPAGVSQAEIEKHVAKAFHDIDGHHDRPDVSKGPAMHLTSTIDVIVLVKGSVRLVLDEQETVLRAGDVVVQRGTNHAWVCEGAEPALLVAVLISKTFSA